MFYARYEDLLLSPEEVLTDLARFLSARVSPEQVRSIVSRYDRESLMGKETLLHFNRGTARRFREIMTRDQLDLCNARFGGYLERMGYPVM